MCTRPQQHIFDIPKHIIYYDSYANNSRHSRGADQRSPGPLGFSNQRQTPSSFRYVSSSDGVASKNSRVYWVQSSSISTYRLLDEDNANTDDHSRHLGVDRCIFVTVNPRKRSIYAILFRCGRRCTGRTCSYRDPARRFTAPPSPNSRERFQPCPCFIPPQQHGF